MKLDNYITELLYDHECVIVPEMGGFLTRYHPAEINDVRHTFSPPSKRASFNIYLSHNDGLLASRIAQHENIPYDEAKKMIRNYAGRCRKDLDTGKKFIIEGVGELYKDAEQKVQFDPFETNFSKESFGMPIVVTGYGLRDNYGLTGNQKPETFSIKMNNVILVVSLLWLIINVFFIFPSDFSFASLNLFSGNTQSVSGSPDQDSVTHKQQATNDQPLTPKPEIANSKSETGNHKPETFSEGKYYLIAGVFWYNGPAERYKAEMKNQGFEAAGIIEQRNKHKLVYLKAYSTMEAASAALKAIEKEKSNLWIYRQ